MKIFALLTLLVALQGGADGGREIEPSPSLFVYQRALTLPGSASGQACTVVDAAMMEHTRGRMRALRLYQRSQGRQAWSEAPFKFLESGEAGQAWSQAQVENLGTLTDRSGAKDQVLSFDLAMPARTYTEVDLDLAAHNFYATAKVWGISNAGERVALGQFALFDLQSKGLSRSVSLNLQEASFPQLHVELQMTASPGAAQHTFAADIVRGAGIPPSREAQALYTVVASTGAFTQKGRETLASLALPAYTPVARVEFTLQSEFQKNFSRNVDITASPGKASRGAGDASTQDETVSGEIHRVVTAGPGGEELRSEDLTVEAMLGANLRESANVQVAIKNGDDPPLPLAQVVLEMRQRELCFEAQPAATYVLRYGLPENLYSAAAGEDDIDVRPPVYDYARTFQASATPVKAMVGAEVSNPDFSPSALPHRWTLPKWLLWVALIAVIAALGWVAVGSTTSFRRGNGA